MAAGLAAWKALRGSEDMRLEAISITNFRCYGDEIRVELDDLTTFVGRNDIGKSAIQNR